MSEPTNHEDGSQETAPPRAAGSLFNDPEQTGQPPQPPQGYAPQPPVSAYGEQPQPPAYAPQIPTYGAQPQPQPNGWQTQQPGVPNYQQPVVGGAAFIKPGQEQLPLGQYGVAEERVNTDLPWRWWVSLLGIFTGFASIIVVAMVLGIGVAAAGGDTDSIEDNLTEVLTLAQQVLWIATALLIPFIAARYLRPSHLGLGKVPGRAVAFGIGFGCLMAFYALAFFYTLALGLDENSNDLLNDTGFGDSVAKDALLAVVFTIGAPLSEELLFRGLLFGALCVAFARKLPRSGPYLAAVVSGVLFGAIHAGQGQDKYLPMLMALGILLALSYYWSGTLYVPIAIHAINNSAATGFNSEPTADWIYVIIALATPLSVLLAMGLGKFVKARFPNERRLKPPSPQSPFLPPPGRPAGL